MGADADRDCRHRHRRDVNVDTVQGPPCEGQGVCRGSSWPMPATSAPGAWGMDALARIRWPVAHPAACRRVQKDRYTRSSAMPLGQLILTCDIAEARSAPDRPITLSPEEAGLRQ